MILESLDITPDEFAEGTGWAIKPEGACKADVCVPLGSGGTASICIATADRLGMAVVHDAEAGLWAIGPESFGGRALVSARGTGAGARRHRRHPVRAVVVARPEGRDRVVGAVLRLCVRPARLAGTPH